MTIDSVVHDRQNVTSLLASSLSLRYSADPSLVLRLSHSLFPFIASLCTSPLQFAPPLSLSDSPSRSSTRSRPISLSLCVAFPYTSPRVSPNLCSPFSFPPNARICAHLCLILNPLTPPSRSTLGRALSSSRMKRSFHCCSYPLPLNTASHRHDRFHSVATREMEFRRRAQNPLVHAAMEICIRRCRGIPCTQISCH